MSDTITVLWHTERTTCRHTDWQGHYVGLQR